MYDDDLLAELPPLRDDEPSSLRDDIAAELADHLACAYRRELLTTSDPDRAHSTCSPTPAGGFRCPQD